jgi:hypothetical protein
MNGLVQGHLNEFIVNLHGVLEQRLLDDCMEQGLPRDGLLPTIGERHVHDGEQLLEEPLLELGEENVGTVPAFHA